MLAAYLPSVGCTSKVLSQEILDGPSLGEPAWRSDKRSRFAWVDWGWVNAAECPCLGSSDLNSTIGWNWIVALPSGGYEVPFP